MDRGATNSFRTLIVHQRFGPPRHLGHSPLFAVDELEGIELEKQMDLDILVLGNEMEPDP